MRISSYKEFSLRVAPYALLAACAAFSPDNGPATVECYASRMQSSPARWIVDLTLCCGLLAGMAAGQAPADGPLAPATAPQGTAPSAGVTPDTSRRDVLLKPGQDALRAGDAAAALAAFKPALEAYPNDLLVLSYCAEAAMESHQDEAALGFFNRALAVKTESPWHMRLGLMVLEARMGRWAEFDRDQAALKAAKESGDGELVSTPGFLIDEFVANGKAVRVAYFPELAGKYHTLYRFVLPAPPKVDVPGEAKGDPCKDPNFRPYLDVESDDADQVSFKTKHPDLAAKGGRSYSLDTYPAACSQGLIKFYWDGEPTYETVRADVMNALNAKPASSALTEKVAPAKP